MIASAVGAARSRLSVLRDNTLINWRVQLGTSHDRLLLQLSERVSSAVCHWLYASSADEPGLSLTRLYGRMRPLWPHNKNHTRGNQTVFATLKTKPSGTKHSATDPPSPPSRKASCLAHSPGVRGSRRAITSFSILTGALIFGYGLLRAVGRRKSARNNWAPALVNLE